MNHDQAERSGLMPFTLCCANAVIVKRVLIGVLAVFSVIPQVAGQATTATPGPTKVGPPRGTLIGTGGGTGLEIMSEFIKAAGGPDALIVLIPTSSSFGGDVPEGNMTSRRIVGGIVVDFTEQGMAAPLKSAGARNVQVIHTRDRNVANSDNFVAPLKRAGGVWTTGGNPDLFMEAYSGTKMEQELRNLLDRGGVIGGASAGAIILGSDGPPAPAMTRYFGFLRNAVFWPHATSTNQLPAFQTHAAQHPDLIDLAVDEPAAWLIKGDIATVIGTGRAYVYGEDPRNPGAHYITLRSGDQYNLATRAVVRSR